jgi:phenylalanyl-tRNA synthetase beta chain
MRLSFAWLREFTPYEGSVDALADRLTMLGLEVEEIVRPFAGIQDIVVGRVLTCEKHPQADTLSLCSVDVGQGQPLSIVCGAPNVAAGQLVPVALIGTTLPNGLTLKKSKIRGALSEGMICAEDELGLGEDHSGILVLDPALSVGARFVDSLGLDDTVLDVSITPNRMDCLSVLGLAREVAMAFKLPLRMPVVKVKESGASATEVMRIEIPEPELCPVYQGRVIEGVRVGRSPAWLRYRLLSVGQRPISNVVDVTNFVMLELGQPLHAFDLDRLAGGLIRVARAPEGFVFTTLDGQERTLNANDLLIWDGEKPVALAGVMGGQNSEMDGGSTRVLLESAVFKPGSIRRTARRLGLPSEASYRFERGVDQPGSLFAMNRAAALVAELSGGAVRPGVAVAEPLPWKPRVLSFRPSRARMLLGVELSDAFCAETLQALDCQIGQSGDANGAWSVTAPSHRLDFEREADLIEEVGRVYGLDRIEAKLPQVKRALGDPVRHSEYLFNLKIKHWARGAGLREAVNYSFVGHKDLDALSVDQAVRIPVKNPLTDEQNVLRPLLAPGLLQNLRHNIAQGNDRFRLFELAHTFWADPASETTAREPVRLGVLLYGGRGDEGWPYSQEDADYQDLKGLVEHLLGTLRLPLPTYRVKDAHPWLAPCVEAFLDGELLGLLGRVQPAIADQYHGRKEVWIAELDVDLLARQAAGAVPAFQPLPKFPPVKRDLTFAASGSLDVSQILDAFMQQRSPLLERVILADVFIPEQTATSEGQTPARPDRNLTFRLTFRRADRTLKDKEVDKEIEKMVKALTQALPLKL